MAVTFEKNRSEPWKATIYRNKAQRYIDHFRTEAEAFAAVEVEKAKLPPKPADVPSNTDPDNIRCRVSHYLLSNAWDKGLAL